MFGIFGALIPINPTRGFFKLKVLLIAIPDSFFRMWAVLNPFVKQMVKRCRLAI